MLEGGPLRAVVVVCREFPSASSPDIVQLISDFVYSSPELLVTEVGHDEMTVEVLRRLHSRESLHPFAADRFFRDWQFNQVANKVAAHGNLEVVKWLTTEYSPGNALTEAVVHAAANARLEVVQWLYEDYPFAVVGLRELKAAVKGSHVKTVKYLLVHPPPAERRLEQMSDQEWRRRRIKSSRETICFAKLDSNTYNGLLLSAALSTTRDQCATLPGQGALMLFNGSLAI